MNKKGVSTNTLFANPFFLNGMAWLVVMLLYPLNWSKLCQPLTEEMQWFMWINIAVSLVAGFLTNHREWIKFTPIESYSTKAIYFWLFLCWGLFLVEVAVAGGAPFFSYMRGSTALSYREFGLPIIHVIIVNGLSVLTFYLYYIKRSIPKKDKRHLKLFLLILACFIPFVLMFNRGGILSNLIGMFVIMILSTKKLWRNLAATFVAGLIILFGFGIAGNMRFGPKLKNAILAVGGATTEFKNSSIPDEFFWAYIYMCTPLANTQNTVSRGGDMIVDSEDFQNLIIYEFTPELVSKRVLGVEEDVKKQHSSVLITESLNATSVYGSVYRQMGWPGMWLMFLFILLFMLINIRIVNQDSKWFVPTLAVVDVIMIMNVFDNMFVFMGAIPQLFILLLIYFTQKCLGKRLR